MDVIKQMKKTIFSIGEMSYYESSHYFSADKHSVSVCCVLMMDMCSYWTGVGTLNNKQEQRVQELKTLYRSELDKITLLSTSLPGYVTVICE